MAHTKGVLASFQDGETRLVYARRVAGSSTEAGESDELFLLPDGEADTYREYTREHLRCLVPDCPDPRLKTVSRSRGRDGFSHYARAGGHDPEGPFHIQACEMMRAWLAEKYDRSTARKEEVVKTDKRVERRADVMLTAPEPSKNRLAFEIQYASLTPAAWQKRHDSYAELGIPDVWLFGHFGDHLKAARGGEGDMVALNPTHEAVARAGQLLLWVNPITRQIGTVVTERVVDGKSFTIPATQGRARFIAESLDDEAAGVRVTSSGLTSNLLQQLREDRAAYAQARAIQERRIAEEEARREAERQRAEARRVREEAERKRKAAERKARNRSEWQERQRRAAALAERAEPAWHSSELKGSVMQRFGGQWPPFLDIDVGIHLPVPRQQWQAQLWSEFIDGQASFTQVAPSHMVTALTPIAAEVRMADATLLRAVQPWLNGLVRFEVLLPLRSTRGQFPFTHAVPRRPGEPEEEEPVAPPPPVVREKVSIKETLESIKGNPPCRRCRVELFDSQIQTGYHTRCLQ